MVRACIEAIRPVNSFMMGLAVIVGAAIASSPGQALDPVRLFMGALVGFLYTGASMIHNDLIDVEVDRVNAPWRPIPSGRLSVGAARLCIGVLAVSGGLVALLLGPVPFVLAVTALAIAMAYNRWGKLSGLPGNVMVAFIVSFPLIYGSAVAGSYTWASIVFIGMVFLSALAREIVKDIADIEGDRRAGARTLPITRGPLYSSRVAAALYMAAVALSVIPPVMGSVNRGVYIASIGLVDLLLAREAYLLARGVDGEAALRHKRRVLYIMLIGLLGFLASTSTGAGGWS